MNPDESIWMVVMLQFSDSALPVGAYAHSGGLEGLCQAGAVRDEDSLRLFLLRDVRHALVSVDLPLAVRAHRAASDGDGQAVRHWDDVAAALRPARELREASGKVGRRLWLLYEETWRSRGALSERSWFRGYQAPVVGGVVFAERGVAVEGLLWSVAYQACAGLVQAALKLLPLGPASCQRLLHEALSGLADSFPAVLAVPDDALGSFNPVWDIAASRHERAAARLFVS